MEPAGERLNKYLALHSGSSRREADELIAQGKVRVNGLPAVIGQRVHTGDTVAIHGKTVQKKTNFSYIAFNKPVGYVCSRKPQGDTPTIYSLLPEKYHSLKPVGRLDKDSSGILLLTDDGDFAHHMTHPSFHKVKVYEVTLDQPLQPLHQQMINDFGIMLEDGKSQFTIEKIARPQSSRSTASKGQTYQITMHEGRNRQIRRTFAALGYTVTKLHRTQFGAYSDSQLKIGTYQLTQNH